MWIPIAKTGFHLKIGRMVNVNAPKALTLLLRSLVSDTMLVFNLLKTKNPIHTMMCFNCN